MASTRALRPSMGSLLQPCSRPTTCSPSPILLLTQQHAHQPRPSPQSRSFTTTPAPAKRHTYIGARKTRDANKHRGESTVRRTGTRWRLSVSDDPLPRPTPKADLPAVETDPDHGLWDFFYGRELVVPPPAQMGEHGRAWTVHELRAKGWDDLHALWWVCCKEQNRISTAGWEREKAKYNFGSGEEAERTATVKQTMKRIRFVLLERFYSWEDARKLAETDPEINLAGGGKNGPVFTPSEYMVEEEVEAEAAPEEIKAGEVAEEGGAEKEKVTEQDEVKLDVDPATLPPAGEAAKEAPRV